MSPTQPIKLSIISPVYQAESFLDELVERLVAEAGKLVPSFEIILVEDRSADGSWAKVVENCRRYPCVKGVRLSKNFGQHNAITAGLKISRGEYVAVIDCDLQDDPIYLGKLFSRATQGVDVVLTVKKSREHSVFKNASSKIFQWVLNLLSENRDTLYNPNVGSYSVINRKVVDAILQIQDYRRHYLMLAQWVGFNKEYVEIEHRRRPRGKSSYGLKKLFVHAVDGIIFQSNRLLYLGVAAGLGMLVISLFSALYILVGYFQHGYKEGWASTLVVILLCTGSMLLCLGIHGGYLAKTLEQTRSRPLFLVDEMVGFGGVGVEERAPRSLHEGYYYEARDLS